MLGAGALGGLREAGRRREREQTHNECSRPAESPERHYSVSSARCMQLGHHRWLMCERVIVQMAHEGAEIFVRHLALRLELLNATAAVDGLAGEDIALGVDRHRVKRREITRHLAGTAEPGED